MGRRGFALAGSGGGRPRGRRNGASQPPGRSRPGGLALLVMAAAVALPALPASGAGPADAYAAAPWLDVPSGWSRTLQEGSVVAVMPDDLPAGRSFLLLVEPPGASTATLAEDYEAALADLGPWSPVGQPIEQATDGGWVFRLGVGVTRLGGETYTAQTAVARRGSLRARFWALADSDDTYNRYKAALGNAIASVQDLTAPAAPAPPAGPTPDRAASAPPAAGSGLDPGFGQGLSGVYVGLERGLVPGAGPAVPRLTIADAMEVDVLFPDGTYRRRLPIRGFGGDMAWERRQQPALWGTWTRQGNQVVVRRGSYSTVYTVAGTDLVSDRDRLWRKLPPAGGTRLEGSYAREDYRDSTAPRLVLHADGRYEDRGGFLRMVGSAWHLVVPDGDTLVERWSQAEADRALAGGSGTYTFDAFTLALDDRDGRRWQINAYLPPGESLPSPARLVINGRALVRD